VREQPGQERRAAAALHELGGAGEQPQHDAQQGRVWDRPRRDVDEQLRASRHRRALDFRLGRRRTQFIEPMRMSQFLHEEGMKILARQLLEKCVESAHQRGVREPRRRGTLVERQLPERVIRLQPVLREITDQFDQLGRRARGEVLFTIPF
jgi:hypothetical protein